MFQKLRFDVGNSEIIRKDQLLLAYRLFCLFNYPLWKLILVLRKAKGKEHIDRYTEKLGLGYLPRPEGEVIWVHALGLGETLSLTLFLQKLSSFNKDKTILFTSSTLQSYAPLSCARSRDHFCGKLCHIIYPRTHRNPLAKPFELFL